MSRPYSSAFLQLFRCRMVKLSDAIDAPCSRRGWRQPARRAPSSSVSPRACSFFVWGSDLARTAGFCSPPILTLRDAGDLRILLRHDGVGKIVDGGERQRLRVAQDKDRRIRRVTLR